RIRRRAPPRPHPASPAGWPSRAPPRRPPAAAPPPGWRSRRSRAGTPRPGLRSAAAGPGTAQLPGRGPASGRPPRGSCRLRPAPTRGRRPHAEGAPSRRPAPRRPVLIPIVVGLVRALDREPHVGGLVGAQLGQTHAQGIEVEPSDLLVEV